MNWEVSTPLYRRFSSFAVSFSRSEVTRCSVEVADCPTSSIFTTRCVPPRTTPESLMMPA